MHISTFEFRPEKNEIRFNTSCVFFLIQITLFEKLFLKTAK